MALITSFEQRMFRYNIAWIKTYVRVHVTFHLFVGEYSVEWTASHQVLRLIAFCTCLIRLLGAAFSTLKMARYKEFIKQVGRTIR